MSGAVPWEPSTIRDGFTPAEIPDAAPNGAEKVLMPYLPHGWLAMGFMTSPLRGFRSPEAP
jgi:hypothetical protein